MKKLTSIVVRLALTAVLIYFVYLETGWATALALGLITLSNELIALSIRNILTCVNVLKGRL